MKKFNNKKVRTIGLAIVAVGLFFAGINTTIQYNRFIEHTKAQGVSEFKSSKCDIYANPKTNQTWLECDL